jgi:hypothetical protein
VRGHSGQRGIQYLQIQVSRARTFQLDTQGGIIQSFCSWAVTLRGGLRKIGGGGDGGPRGIFLPLNLGGSRGSSTTSICYEAKGSLVSKMLSSIRYASSTQLTILMMRCFVPSPVFGVYLIYDTSPADTRGVSRRVSSVSHAAPEPPTQQYLPHLASLARSWVERL